MSAAELAVKTLLELGAAVVSDALDRLGLPGSALGIMPLGSGQRMCGPAFTVRYVPAGAQPSTVGDFLDDCTAGDVVVIDNGGRRDCTVWGGIMTVLAHQRGIAGTAIHGVCRDVRKPLELGYPIYSAGRFMRTGKDRVAVAGINEVVTLGDAQVRPGDLVLGDDDGVVVIPQDRRHDVLETAVAIGKAEDSIIAALRDGESLASARARFNYHVLQRDKDT